MPPKPRLSSPIHAIIMPSVRVLAATVLVISSGPAGAADVFLTDDQDSGEDWNTAAKWSDGAAPVAGNNYFTQGFLLRTPTVNSAAADFNGDRLTVGPGGTLLLATPHSGTTPPGDVTSVGDLVFDGGTLAGTSTTATTVQWLGGNVEFAGTTQIDLSDGDRIRMGWVGGNWTGSGDIIMTGNDANLHSNDLLFLSGVDGSAHSGDWTISQSRLILTGGNNLGDSSRITLGVRGGLDIRNNSTETIGSLASAETSSRVRNGVAGTTGTLRSGGDGTDSSFAGVIEDGNGIMGLVKQGSGTFTLTNNQTYSGATVVEGGVLRVEGTLSDSTAVSIQPGGVLEIANSNPWPWGADISGEGTLRKTGGNAVRLFGDNAGFSGTIEVGQGALRAGSATALGTDAVVLMTGGDLSLNGWSAAIGSLEGASGRVLNSGGGGSGPDSTPVLTVGSLHASTTFGGQLIEGIGLTKVGTGTLMLTGNNTYTGPTTVEAGTLRLLQGGRLSNSTSVELHAGATLDLETTSWLFEGSISGEGGLTKSGTSGDVRLTGNNTYTGPTLVAGTRILRAGSNQSFGDNSALTVETAATLDLNGWSNVVGSLSGDGTIRNLPGTNGPGTDSPTVLTIGGNHEDAHFAGTLTDLPGGEPMGLTKQGDGSQTLSGVNTYRGETRIEGGTLNVAGSISGTSAVIVVNDGRLSGGGHIVTTGNSTLIGTGATLAPGDSAVAGTGNLVLETGDLVFEPGSFWEVNISGGDHGRLVLGGPTTLDLTNIGLATGVVPVAPLLDASTGYQILEILEGEVTGQFSNMTTGGPFAGSFPGADGFVDLSGIAFAVYLNAVLDGDGRVMDGGGIVLIASPEPGRAMLLAMAGLLVLGGRRRG